MGRRGRQGRGRADPRGQTCCATHRPPNHRWRSSKRAGGSREQGRVRGVCQIACRVARFPDRNPQVRQPSGVWGGGAEPRARPLARSRACTLLPLSNSASLGCRLPASIRSDARLSSGGWSRSSAHVGAALRVHKGANSGSGLLGIRCLGIRRPGQHRHPAIRLGKRSGVGKAAGATLAFSACPVAACNASRGRRGRRTLSLLLGILARRPELSRLPTRLVWRGVCVDEATRGATLACSARPVAACNAQSRRG